MLLPVCTVMAAVEAAVVVEAPLLAAHGTTGAHGGGAGAAAHVGGAGADGRGAALKVAANGRGVAELQPVFMTNIKMTPPTALRRHFDS